MSEKTAHDYRITNFLGAGLSVMAITAPTFGQKFFLPIFFIVLAVFIATASLVTLWKTRCTRFGWIFIPLISTILLTVISFADLYIKFQNAAPDSNEYNNLRDTFVILPFIVFGFCLIVSLSIMSLVHFAGKYLNKKKLS